MFDSFGARLVLVALGGGAGAVGRALVGHYLIRTTAFPWATFAINVSGSLLLGFLAAFARHRPDMLALLGAGFCGGYTTFSTFSLESIRMVEDGRWADAAGYALGSVLAGVAAAFVGLLVGRAVVG